MFANGRMERWSRPGLTVATNGSSGCDDFAYVCSTSGGFDDKGGHDRIQVGRRAGCSRVERSQGASMPTHPSGGTGVGLPDDSVPCVWRPQTSATSTTTHA